MAGPITETGSRLAIDIGGTFTDVVLRSADGSIVTAKVPTTPEDITRGILAGIERVGGVKADLDAFIHGTTIGLNALLQGNTPTVGLITTLGFRDVLEIMRTNRPRMYDLQYEKPRPLVPRRLRREITERIAHTGHVLTHVDEDEVLQIASDFKSSGVACVAVCLLHSYANPDNERAVRAALSGGFATSSISISSDLNPQWREFERTSTTVINAAIKPIMSQYLSMLEDELANSGFSGAVLLMQSNGGVMSAEEAKERPVATLMSGPVGGVAAAIEVATRSSPPASVVTLDIGGTSADVAVVDGGEALTRSVGQIAGWPVMVPMIDIHTIGAGGGSIARVDRFGSLQVGPESAGAAPGPACYMRGGTSATVTDANLVLGRLNPEYFLGGELPLSIEAARSALYEHVGEPYAFTSEQSAEAVITVINSTMTRLLWEVMIARGMDPREFALLAFGGAGPLHACELAGALGMKEVLIPPEPGMFSAGGMIGADIRHDYAQMMLGSTKRPRASDVVSAFETLRAQAVRQLKSQHTGYDRLDVVRSVELRYAGQHHPLMIELADSQTDVDLDDLYELFHSRHHRLYGFRREDAAVELVKVQLTAVGRIRAAVVETKGLPGQRASAGMRDLYVDGAWVASPVYRRGDLGVGADIAGPACVEEPGSTTYLPAGSTLSVDDGGMLRIALSPDSTRGWV